MAWPGCGSYRALKALYWRSVQSRPVKELLVILFAEVVFLASMAGACYAAAEPAAARPTGEQPNLKVLTWDLLLLPTALDQFSAKLQNSQHLRAP
jgi:hypothetical protein